MSDLEWLCYFREELSKGRLDLFWLMSVEDCMEVFSYRVFTPGEPFTRLTPGAHNACPLSLDQFAGRYTVVCCFGSSCDPRGKAVIEAVLANRQLFDDEHVSFMGITLDPGDQHEGRLPSGVSGLYFKLDSDCKISRHCGAAPLQHVPLGTGFRVSWTISDPTLHVVKTFNAPSTALDWSDVFVFLRSLDQSPYSCGEIPAPVITLPNVFDHDLCNKLIRLHKEGDTHDSGFLHRNVETYDYSVKKRRDYFIDDENIRAIIQNRIATCVIPEIRKLFFMELTHIDRFLVARYAAEENGHFLAHRDNGQTITAHRRFAISIALNDDFEGGALKFPEYNQKLHRTPTGWAIVFPCSILHSVERMTRGNRYAFLPFLYDEAGEAIRIYSP